MKTSIYTCCLILSATSALAHDGYHGDVDMGCVVQIAKEIKADLPSLNSDTQTEIAKRAVGFWSCIDLAASIGLCSDKENPDQKAQCLTDVATEAASAAVTNYAAMGMLEPLSDEIRFVYLVHSKALQNQSAVCLEGQLAKGTAPLIAQPLCSALTDMSMIAVVNGLGQYRDLK